MRFFATFVLPCLAIFFLPTVGAFHRGKSLTRRVDHNISPARSSVLAKRQHHARRDLIDICVSLDATILSTLLHIIDPLHADVHLCLCLQDLDIFLDTDVDALLITNLIGRDRLRALLKVILNTSPHAQHCPLPPHAHRACVTHDPCAFTCDHNYIKEGNVCVCPHPFSECNGHCVDFPRGCPSSTPHHARAPKLTRGPITTLAQAQSTCKPKETVCGIAGREGTFDYECINTENTLDSCGGCMVRHPFPDTNGSSTEGMDCGHLPGILSAECSESRCVISQCQSTMTLNHDKTKCIPTSVTGSRNSRMRKERRKNNTINTKLSVIINSELHTQLGDLVVLVANLVAEMGFVSHTIPGTRPGYPPLPNYVEPINAIARATANILVSPTFASLVEHIDTLVHLTTSLLLELDRCGCVKDLGLKVLFEDLKKVINSALAAQRWCENHPSRIPSHPGNSNLESALLSTTNGPSNAAIIGLSDISNEIKLGIKVPGSQRDKMNRSLNKLSDGLGTNPPNEWPRRDGIDVTAVVNAGLLDRIEAIVHLALTLKDNSATLPAPGSPIIPSPVPTPLIDQNLVKIILQAVTHLSTSTQVSVLLNNIDALLGITDLVSNTLGGCGCVDKLGLETIVIDVENILNAASGLKIWCSDHPIIVHPPGQTPGTPSTSPHPGGTPSSGLDNILGLPISLKLGDLLASLGVDLDVDGTLQGLVQTLVTLVVKLQIDSSALPELLPALPPHSTPIPFDRNMIDTIVNLSGKILLSRTLVDLVASTEKTLDAVVRLRTVLDGCGCVGNLGLIAIANDVKIIASNLVAIKYWCGSYSVHGMIQSGGRPDREYIIIDAKRLLSALGLDGLLEVNGKIDLGDGLGSLTKPVTGLLGSLGLGGLRRWLGP